VLERLRIVQRDRAPIKIGNDHTVFPAPPGIASLEEVDHHVTVDSIEGQQDSAQKVK
jgi:hypothetical protein